MNVLVIRNDKLGDFMLAWPALSALKGRYPESRVYVLVPGYTKPLAEICPWIDEVIIDEPGSSALEDVLKLSHKIRHARIDASISLFSQTRTSLALWLARVPRRFGPATKLAQLFLNNRLKQRRSSSFKPEYEYNTDLVHFYTRRNRDEPAACHGAPYLSFDPDRINTLKQDFFRKHRIDASHRLIFIHPGSGGSAINLSLQQYAELAMMLSQRNRLYFVITAGPGEIEIAESLAALMPGIEHTIHHSTQGLVNFCMFIAMCDLFISGSTGPLHIAGALDVPTAAFYPARRSATRLRWQTLNQPERRLAFSPETCTGKEDMDTIDIAHCAAEITDLLRQADSTNN